METVLASTYLDLETLSVSELKEKVLEDIDNFIFDIDGTLRDNMFRPYKFAIALLDGLIRMGKNVFLFTNNTFLTRHSFLEEWKTLVPSLKIENIITPLYLTAEYLKAINIKGKIFASGDPALFEELRLAGITQCITEERINSEIREHMRMKLDSDVKCVILSEDNHFNMTKLNLILSYILDPEVLFIVPNDQPVNISSLGLSIKILATTHCFLPGIERETGRRPMVMGKPSDHAVEFFTKTLKLDPKKTLMVGDMFKYDVLFGFKCGFKTLMVLNGLETLEDRKPEDPMPTYVAPSLETLAKCFPPKNLI